MGEVGENSVLYSVSSAQSGRVAVGLGCELGMSTRSEKGAFIPAYSMVT